MFRKDLKPGEDVEELKLVWETLGSAQVRMVRTKKNNAFAISVANIERIILPYLSAPCRS